MKFVTIFGVFLCSIFSVVKTNRLVFADIKNMEELIVMQSQVIHHYSGLLRLQQKVPQNNVKRRRVITEYIAGLEVEHRKAMKNITYYLSNPINAYRLVKRLSIDFEFATDVDIAKNIDYEKGYKGFFTNKTIMLASFAILNLQVQYNLSVEDVSNGILKINKSSIYPDAKDNDIFIENVTPLTSTDCYVLATWIAKEKAFTAAHKWLDEARRKFHDECHSYNDCLYSLMDYSDFEQTLYVEAATYRRSYRSMPIISNPLCSGEHYQKGLTCQYRYGPHPFLRLARFKTETVHNDPDVTMFHDVISDEEIAVFETLSSKRWRTATTSCQLQDHLNAEPCDKIRMGQVAHIVDQLDDKFKKISIRVLDMSGRMGQSLAELWHVTQYGPGGYYKEHYDVAPNWTQHRSSTTIFYLSDVQIGGATTFNELRIGVNPKKHSAIHWQNLIPSIGFDSRTVHASCPLLFGFKMIALKWISEFIDYCPLERDTQLLLHKNDTDDKRTAAPWPLFRLSYDFQDIGKLHTITKI